ncbi:hypothetical protein DFH27DRAFT_69975 [Peziza echinospora]|nr:hypothetical protein DFH27DRAFT_69975 [Peziza echinospora]
MLLKSIIVASAIGLLSSVSASLAAGYEQCGGYNHNGPTLCERGYHCERLNDYFYQCLPGQDEQQRTATESVHLYAPTPTINSRRQATNAPSSSRIPSVPNHLVEFARRERERRAQQDNNMPIEPSASAMEVMPMYPFPTQTLTPDDLDQINLLDDIEREILRFARNGGGFVAAGSVP